MALLAPYLASLADGYVTKAGEAAFDGTKSLMKAIRDKFAHDGDQYAEQSLQRLQDRPDDEGRQSALRSILQDKADADSAFAEDLKRLVTAVTGRQRVGSFLTQVYGGEVGKIVNIQTAGTVTLD